MFLKPFHLSRPTLITRLAYRTRRSRYGVSCPDTAQEQVPFRAGVNEVIVPVTVTDDKGRFVSDLSKATSIFSTTAENRKIDYFSHQQSQPVVIGFLIDMSNSMKVDWDRYKESTTELMLNLLPGDKKYSGYLITYGNEAELVTDTSSDSGGNGSEDEQR